MKHIIQLSIIPLLLLFLILLSSCCDEDVELHVYIGHLSEDECKRRVDTVNSNADDIVFACPGEEVTLCWGSNVSDVTLEPGIGTVGPSGIKYVTVDSDTDFVAKPPSGSCASSATVKVNVVKDDTPGTWEGNFDSVCSKIEFEIHKEFISEKIKAKDITALWSPIIELKEGGTYVCTTPPFLDGFHVEEVFGFKIEKPNITEAFSRKLKAVGNWQFVWKANCDGVQLDCPGSQSVNFPFDLTLTCIE